MGISLTRGRDPVQDPLTGVDPFSVPGEPPFLALHQTSSTPIDLYQHQHQQGLPRHKVSASWESSRGSVPLGALSKMQRHSYSTTALNDAADTHKWMSGARNLSPNMATGHHNMRASSAEYSKKPQPKRQDDASKRNSSWATQQPQLSPPRSPALHASPHKHISSGVAFYSRIVAQQQEKLVVK